MAKQFIMFPPGRYVRGSLYKGNDKDAEGRPLVYKTGADAGKPRQEFFFAVAIPKTPGQVNWWDTEWGKIILGIGSAAFPQLYQTPTFAWKITDGDSAVPNKRGKAPNTRDGYPGCWIVGFASGSNPRIVDGRVANAPRIDQEGFVNPGDFVQVYGSVDGNGSPNQPGLFINHVYVGFVGFGPRIELGVDPGSLGFGVAALPAGASATPLAGSMPAAPAVAAPGMPAAPMMAAPGVPAMAAPVAVAPNPAFLQPAMAPGVPAGIPMPPAAPAAPAARQMTAKANGATYDQFISQGWTDQALVAQGFMLG